jgi:hypothetical protein
MELRVASMEGLVSGVALAEELHLEEPFRRLSDRSER